jgi:hypothetical protein
VTRFVLLLEKTLLSMRFKLKKNIVNNILFKLNKSYLLRMKNNQEIKQHALSLFV